MAEGKVDAIFQKLVDLPEAQRPQIRSLLVSLFASAHEAEQETKKAEEAWHVNDQFLLEAVDKDPRAAFEFAVSLATLPYKQKDGKYDWFRRYLLGNGLTILADQRLTGQLVEYINNDPQGQFLADVIQKSFLVDVGGWDQAKIYRTPESFNLYAALAVGLSLQKSQPLSKAWTLALNAGKIKEKVPHIIDAFRPLPEAARLTAIIQPEKS